MRVSDKKATAAYSAIGDPIDKLRIENSGGSTIEEMDFKLFNLQEKIWQNLIDVLNLETIK